MQKPRTSTMSLGQPLRTVFFGAAPFAARAGMTGAAAAAAAATARSTAQPACLCPRIGRTELCTIRRPMQEKGNLPAAVIRKSPADFVVEEIAAYPASGEGDHLLDRKSVV